MLHLRIFGLEFENTIVISNQRPQICLVSKFGAKIKILQLGTKNALFGYFLGWNLKIILPYLKSAP